MTSSFINIRGARTHNLKSVDLDLPKGKLIVFTGPSGSGKSSLALDTLAAEGQRRYLESLSTFSRQVLGSFERPDCDAIRGLMPTISLGQHLPSPSSRATVGTVSEIDAHLRILYARAGTAHCPHCERAITATTPGAILEEILKQPEGSRWMLLAPAALVGDADLASVLARFASEGFVRVRLNGTTFELDALPAKLPALSESRVELVVDRLVLREGVRERLSDSLETALELGEGKIVLAPVLRDGEAAREEIAFATRLHCAHCDHALSPLEPRLFSFNSALGACKACQGQGYVDSQACPSCEGERLSPEARAVRLGEGGPCLADIQKAPLSVLPNLLETLPLSGSKQRVASELLSEIQTRLRFLLQMRLGNLQLARPTLQLSLGETQRLRLASQLGSELSGVLYILDEPSLGLHPSDLEHLSSALRTLRDLGNTVLLVEHDEHLIRAADLVVDLGPGAGAQGGELLAMASPSELAQHSRSVTGPWLSGQKRLSRQSRKVSQWLHFEKDFAGPLGPFSFEVPLGAMSALIGPSGSGKTLLLERLIGERVRQHVGREALTRPVSGIEGLDKVVSIDQSPIGKSPRSNPASFTRIFDDIRELFAATRDARSRGFSANRFSFNVKGGRCEACEGEGVRKVELQLLPDLWLSCDACGGQRYNEPTLGVRYKGLTIAEVLALSVSEARTFFAPVTRIARVLDTLDAVGLGYLRLGQSAHTLSGGEAQRLKLARELARPSTGATLFLLDEPSAGLHFEDIARLLDVLERLVDRGNTVVLADHHMGLASVCDWVIELPSGDSPLHQGYPSDLAEQSTPSAMWLKSALSR